MSAFISSTELVIHLIVFATIMLAATYFFRRKVGEDSLDHFLVVDRQVPWWFGGPSITASWTWAIALLISIQLAYEQGLAGIFWFTLPNVFAVLMYIAIGPKIRKLFPTGYSLPQWMGIRYKSQGVLVLYALIYLYYQLMAAVVQIYAGGKLLAAVSGTPVEWLMPAVVLVTLSYALLSGMQASIVTDVIQTAMIIILGWFVVGVVVSNSGGVMDFRGVSGKGGVNPFQPGVFLTLGVINSIGLLSGAICDQQFWQRCFSIRADHLRKSFVFGALLFASIPLVLAVLGFTAAAKDNAISIAEGVDPSLVGVVVVAKYASHGILLLFIYMIFAGLCSTLDAAFSAVSSMTPRTLFIDESSPSRSYAPTITGARWAMIALASLGLAVSYLLNMIPGFGLKYLWWIMNTVAAAVVLPTVLSLYTVRITAGGILAGASIGVLIGLPIVAYASLNENDKLLAAAYFGIIVSSAICLLVFRIRERYTEKK